MRRKVKFTILCQALLQQIWPHKIKCSVPKSHHRKHFWIYLIHRSIHTWNIRVLVLIPWKLFYNSTCYTIVWFSWFNIKKRVIPRRIQLLVLQTCYLQKSSYNDEPFEGPWSTCSTVKVSDVNCQYMHKFMMLDMFWKLLWCKILNTFPI